MNLCFHLFLLAMSFCVAPNAAQGLSSLFRSLQKNSAGRHNTRDLSYHDSTQEGRPQPIVPFRNMRLCINDRMCDRSQFCDQHYGVCRNHMSEGKACRRDAMCQSGYHCMFGMCHKRIKRGREGARCRHERDCGTGMCCARRHGEKVCQRRQPLGHKCFVPDGGLDYSMSERCPCESGLVCQYMAPQPPSSGTILTLFAFEQNMRCAVPGQHQV